MSERLMSERLMSDLLGRRIGAAVAAGALVFALSGVAAAQATGEIDRALAEMNELRYEQARSLLFDVIRSGKATAPELSKAYFNIGVSEAALGNGTEATDAFYLALMVEPTLVLPKGGSPKIREYLNSARMRVMHVGVLEAHLTLQQSMLGVTIDNDPLSLVKKAKVVFGKGEGDSSEAELDPSGKMRIEVGDDVTGIDVSLLDENGNQLKALKLEPGASTTQAPAPASAPKDAADGPSWIGNWGLWAGVAAFFGATGTYFIVKQGKVQSRLDDYSARPDIDPRFIDDLQSDKDRYGLFGLVSLGAAGAAAITAGTIVILSGGDEEEKQATVVPKIGLDRIGAELNVRF
jgi:hypothetical protein